jgi:formate--tetrahydrofolate ligase
MCRAEYNPCLVHAGPFANIAVGQSSIIADRVGLTPHVSVLTATVRALKMHGGGPKVVPGKALPDAYTKEDVGLVEKGCENLVHLIGVIRKAGINPVVCINRFVTDTKAECAAIRRAAEAAGARCAESQHWLLGGDGALDPADAVIDAAKETPKFKFLYPLEMPLKDRVDLIAKEIYGADGVDWAPEADAKAKMLAAADPRRADLLRSQVPVSVRGRDQPDAGHELEPSVPAHRRRSEDGEGVGAVLDR